MPSLLRVSGPNFVRKGTTDSVKPRALVSTCEDCGGDYAPFGIMFDGKFKTYCSWENGVPTCNSTRK